jgi:predicted amino acid dehydrogenase
VDRQPASLDFAIIGHQENWQQVTEFVNSVRREELGPLSDSKLKNIFPYIPPRELFKIKINSGSGKPFTGTYIETFINPDQLTTEHIRTNISKVKEAARVAEKLKAKIATLGGFTSIVIEGNTELIEENGTSFTTGNTLTAAFIVKGVEKAAGKLQLDLSNSNLQVIGATGDIGQAVSRYFASRVKRLFLCARNEQRLKKLFHELKGENANVEWITDPGKLLADSDVIISAASTSSLPLHNINHRVLICDAGYPKNLQVEPGNDRIQLFYGGMGIALNGFHFVPDYQDHFYKFPVPYIVHGCILEGIVLAFENHIAPFSKGKGNISTNNLEWIYQRAAAHNIVVAPFFNGNGLWD